MQVEAGARIVQIFDSWGGELSPRDFETFSLPYLTRMVQALQAKGVPVIVFGTSMSTHLPLLRRTGADVLGCDWRIEIDQARALAGPDVALQGNLDPLALFLPPAEVEQRVADILRRAGPVGHIFNLGPRHPPADVTGRGEAPGRDGAPPRLSRHRAADALDRPWPSRTRTATIIPSVTTPTPARATRLGTSESRGIAASVVTTGTAAAKRAVAPGPRGARAAFHR